MKQKKKTWSEIAMKNGKIKPLKMSKTTLKSHWVDVSDATTFRLARKGIE